VVTALNFRLKQTRGAPILATIAVMLAALAIRLWLMPPLYNQPQFDEPAYMIGGLLMLEGATPGVKFAPGAVTTWPGFVYGALSAMGHLLSPSEEIVSHPLVLRPLFAIDRALFDAYADYADLRAVVMGTVLFTTLLGVLMACILGTIRAGWPGALLCGGLMAFVPAIATLSVQARPYAAAWSFGIAAITFSALLSGRWRGIGAGLCLGLAMASRIEMVLIVPLIMWEFWLRPEQRATVHMLLRVAGISAVTFLIAAPWYVTHFVGNVRKIITVPLEPGMADADLGIGLINLLWSEGLLAAAVLIIIGPVFQPGRERLIAAASAFVVVALLLFGGGHVSRYNGAGFISIVAFAPYGLGAIKQRLSSRLPEALAGIIAFLLVIPAISQTINAGLVIRASWVESKVVEWLAENVPAGTIVYSHPRQIKAIPPTAESADTSWSEVAGVDAWRTKLRERLNQTDLVVSRLPRALSLDHMYQRLGPARRAFFLASPYWGAQPRYDVRIRGYVFAPLAPPDQAREEFLQTGGVLIHYGERLNDLGEPAAAWTAADGTGMFVYLRPANDR